MLTEDLMREVRRLQVRTRRRVEGLFAGEYHSAFKGRGIEFAEVREYEAGDDVRSIDWNVTARAGRPFIKRFIEERELTVMLVVDMSRSGAFSTSAKDKSRVAVELSAVLALAAVQNNDRVGLLIFTDRVELFLPPKKGRNHVLRVLRELLNFEPRGTGTVLAGALDHVGRLLKRRSVVFVVSDFVAPDFDQPLRLIGRKHEVIAVSVSDPRERHLPAAGLVELLDAESGQRIVLDTSSRRQRAEFARLAERDDEVLSRLLAKAKVDRIRVSTEKPFVPELMRYFRVRERRR